MTRDRLVEAIASVNPKGLATVIQAAKNEKLNKRNCVLAVGWMGKYSTFAEFGVVPEYYFAHAVKVENDVREPHDYEDVVTWFDTLENPNEEVLKLLGEYKDDKDSFVASH